MYIFIIMVAIILTVVGTLASTVSSDSQVELTKKFREETVKYVFSPLQEGDINKSLHRAEMSTFALKIARDKTMDFKNPLVIELINKEKERLNLKYGRR